jgi:hypothetical protein
LVGYGRPLPELLARTARRVTGSRARRAAWQLVPVNQARGVLGGGGNGLSPPDANDGEASQESDTFNGAKRPSNNRMKLTSRAFQ